MPRPYVTNYRPNPRPAPKRKPPPHPPPAPRRPRAGFIDSVSKLVVVWVVVVWSAVVAVGIVSLFMHGEPLSTLTALMNFVFWPTLLALLCYEAKAFSEKLLMTMLAQVMGHGNVKLPGMPEIPEIPTENLEGGDDDGTDDLDY